MANERFAAQERQPKTVSEEDLILRSRRGRTIRIRALAAKAMAKKWKREDQPDPKDLAESQTRPDAAQWLAAYLAESAGFWKDEAGVYVDKIPQGKRSNYSRLIFHSSYDAFGAKKYKCRLVFGGNTQRADTYGETFAPTAHTETQNALYAIAASLDLEVGTLKSAYFQVQACSDGVEGILSLRVRGGCESFSVCVCSLCVASKYESALVFLRTKCIIARMEYESRVV